MLRDRREGFSERLDTQASTVEGWTNGKHCPNRSVEWEFERELFGALEDYHRSIERVIIKPPFASLEWRLTSGKHHLEILGCSIWEVNLPGFGSSPDLWRALTLLYAGTKDMRHALVHRRVRVDATTRELIGVDEKGVDLRPITYNEQIAFCRFAQRFAQAVLTGSINGRIEADLRGQLTLLQSHHRIQLAGADLNRPPVRIRYDLGPDHRVDVQSLMAKAKHTFPGVQYVDIELHLVEDKRIPIGELESAPQEIISINMATLPSWLRFS